MIFRAVLWKEYREQRSICLALVVVCVAGLLAAHAGFSVGEPSVHTRELLGNMALVLAWMCGLVCGAMLLAGEQESGTQAFLDTLPTGRWPLWRAKCLAGGLFLLVMLAAIAAVAGWLGLGGEQKWTAGLLLLAAGLAGYGWGLFFSTLSRSVLAAIGLAIVAQLGSSFVLLPVLFVVAALVQAVTGFDGIRVSPWIAGLLWLLAPLALSALLYSRLDRRRRPLDWRGTTALAHWVEGWRQCLWLSWRQGRGLVVVVLACCLPAAALVLLHFALFWPLLTLGLGSLCGVTLFMEEQDGAYRFLGDQRFPLARLWLVKLGLRLGLACLACLLLVLPPLFFQVLREGNPSAGGQPLLFGSYLLTLVSSPAAFALAWLAHGLAVGQLCGLVFRKPLVALVVSLGLAVVLVAVWVPSILLGGLHAWQVLAVPLLLFVCAWLLLPAWAADRLTSRRTLARLALAGVLCAALVGLGLWYRVAEVPAVAVPDDFHAFVMRLDEAEQSETGPLLRSALDRLHDQERQWPQARAVPARPGSGYPEQCVEVLHRGWPDGKPELAGWLDEVFKSAVWKDLARAEPMPVGVIVQPRRLRADVYPRFVHSAALAGTLLAARALQMQKVHDRPEVFVDHLGTALALVRNLENGAPSFAAGVAVGTETDQLAALDRWLEQLSGRPDLLRRALAALRRHRDQVPASRHEHRYADDLVARNSLDEPQEWLTTSIGGPRDDAGRLEVALLATALEAPWERARAERLLALHYLGGERRFFGALLPLLPQGRADAGESAARRRCRLEAAVLKLALRLYQAEKGRPADRLDQLVPAYLPAVPADPFDGAAFRYRLSAGEEIGWPAHPGQAGPHPQATRRAQPGQGVLWSVGEDGRDDGGKQRCQPRARCLAGEDVIFLVPLPARRQR